MNSNNNNSNNSYYSKKRSKRGRSRRVRSVGPKSFGKTRRNIRSEEPRRGYKRLGKGAFGEVHRPPYPCADKKNIYFDYYASNDYVSKFMDELEADNELNIADIIRLLIDYYNTYYCLPEFKCAAAVTNVNRNASLKDTLLISPYCGVSLESIIEGKGPFDFTVDFMLHTLQDLKHVITGIGILHSNKIVHYDLHLGNLIMYLPTFNKNIHRGGAYNILIGDFGNASYYGTDIIQNKNNGIRLRHNNNIRENEKKPGITERKQISLDKGIHQDLYVFIKLSLIPILEIIYNSKFLYLSSNIHYNNVNSKVFGILSTAGRLINVIDRRNNEEFKDLMYDDLSKFNSILTRVTGISDYISEKIKIELPEIK